MDFQQIAVIGAGNVGIGVVTDLVLHGITAVVVDISDEILQRRRSDSARTDHHDMGAAQGQLPRPADFLQDDMPSEP